MMTFLSFAHELLIRAPTRVDRLCVIPQAERRHLDVAAWLAEREDPARHPDDRVSASVCCAG